MVFSASATRFLLYLLVAVLLVLKSSLAATASEFLELTSKIQQTNSLTSKNKNDIFLLKNKTDKLETRIVKTEENVNSQKEEIDLINQNLDGVFLNMYYLVDQINNNLKTIQETRQ